MFDFSDGTQSFALQHCSDTHSIKCYISVQKQKVYDRGLWHLRYDLLKNIKKFIHHVHNHFIPKAREPITYVQCPLQHDEDYAPHIPLDTIESNMLCTKVNQLIPRDAYNLLLEPTIANLVSKLCTYLHVVIVIWLYATALTFHCEIMYCVCTGRATQLVKGAVVIDQIADSKLYTHYSV